MTRELCIVVGNGLGFRFRVRGMVMGQREYLYTIGNIHISLETAIGHKGMPLYHWEQPHITLRTAMVERELPINGHIGSSTANSDG